MNRLKRPQAWEPLHQERCPRDQAPHPATEHLQMVASTEVVVRLAQKLLDRRIELWRLQNFEVQWLHQADGDIPVVTAVDRFLPVLCRLGYRSSSRLKLLV